jgi:uncharacterized protein YeaO (DUF488 family)
VSAATSYRGGHHRRDLAGPRLRRRRGRVPPELPGRTALGARRTALAGSEWLPEVGPTHELRKWLGHDPDKWDEFRRRYFTELDDHPDVWQPLADAAVEGDITLLVSSRDALHNNAVALREYLLARLDEDRAR